MRLSITLLSWKDLKETNDAQLNAGQEEEFLKEADGLDRESHTFKEANSLQVKCSRFLLMVPIIACNPKTFEEEADAFQLNNILHASVANKVVEDSQ